MSQNKIYQTVNEIAKHAKKNGIAHLNTQDEKLNKNMITIDHQTMVNFGSCSYLGLEFNASVKEAAKSAIDCYGTQFSSSRAYLSPIYYDSLESKLKKIFGSPAIVTPTTTLGHIATIPVIVDREDLVILDHQVHNSVQTACNLVKAKGTRVELLRHNRMDLLEKRINDLSSKYNKIWYMADGIYSMYGDAAPLDQIYKLLNKYENFHFYIDDAHAMSCFGKNGRGFALANRTIHPKMIVATSLNKAFASGGGAIVFPNEETAQLIRNVGGPLITSGPMQPSALGAANAVADIHLSPQIKEYQDDLHENIKYTTLMLKKYNLPNLSDSFSPIFFIAASLPKMAYNVINRMKTDGFFLNIGIFPAVPMKNTGIRFTITRLHTFDQIENMISALSKNFLLALQEENISMIEINKAFKIKTNKRKNEELKINSLVSQSMLKVTHKNSIHDINHEEWDNSLGNQGNFNWSTLSLLEASFQKNDKRHENCTFDYIVIKDIDDKIILSTFFSTIILKDDMLANAEVSKEIEVKRKSDPFFMTSKTLILGSHLTEGNHLYLNRKSTYWKDALDILFKLINSIQNNRKISTTMLRDLNQNDFEMDCLMMNNGFFKIKTPDNFKILSLKGNSIEDFYKTLSKNSKRHYRKFVSKYYDNYELEILKKPNEEHIDHFYSLYLNVKKRSHTLNTFTLPKKLFKQMAINENWELLSLSLKEQHDKRMKRKPVAMAFCCKTRENYHAMIGGIDYSFNPTFFCYRQLLGRIVERAYDINMETISLGYTSPIEKKHFNASKIQSCAYVHVKDNYKLEVIETMNNNHKRESYETDQRRVLPV